MDSSQLSVVVVEDHDFQRRMAVQLLKGLGVSRLNEAANGRLALETLRSQGAQITDVLLTDLDMPEMDGIELIRHVAEARLARAVIIASGLDAAMLHSVEQMAMAFGLRVLGNVEKPLPRHRLAAMLEAYCRLQDASVPAANIETAILRPDEVRAAFSAGRFAVEYEPIVEFARGRVVACEALSRWPPFEGRPAVAPSAFIPLVEQTSLIVPFTDAIVERAARQQAVWAARGLDVEMAVNLSMLSLSDLTLADRYAELIVRNGADPRRFVFEITETQVMNETGPALNVLTRLRLKGFGLAIDDFGTGYSSLQQLSRIPFTQMKIDRQFVHNCDREARNRSIIESSLDLARRLRLRTVAEGIETRAEWDVLRSSGCDFAQGWLIRAPGAAGEFAEWAEGYVPPGE